MVNKKKICFKKSGVRWLVSKMPYNFRLVHYISQEAFIESNRRFPKKARIIHDLNCIAEIDLANMFEDKSNE